MGLCGAKADPVDQQITDAINSDAKAAKSIVKVLLLGTGESGKSTVFKQMIKLHGEGLTQDKLQAFHTVVKRNALDSIIAIVQESRRFVEQKHEECAISPELQESIDYAMKCLADIDSGLTVDSEKHVVALWADPGAKATYERFSEFILHMIDNAKYFLDKSHLIFKEDYVVTEEDALKCRVMTTGMKEELFEMSNNFKMLMVDVGGQRSERKKWIPCFDDVQAILFVVAVSEYDQHLFEDVQVNRFDESMKVWIEIINMQRFRDKMFILFLNKVDLFEEKLLKKHIKIGDYCPDFKGAEGDVEVGLKYFEERYVEEQPAEMDGIAVHRTTATDSDLMEKVLDNVKTAVLKNLLGDAGIM